MELFSLQSILLLIVSLYLFFSFFFSGLPVKPSTGKGFKTYPLVGSVPDFLRNRHRFLDWMTEVLAAAPSNTSIFRRLGRFHGVITTNPAVVEHMLKTNFDNFPKGREFTAILHDFLGTGIFNSDGELWKLQRKTASYEFNTKSLRNFTIKNVTDEIQSRLVPLMDRARESGRVLDLQDVLERFAFDNVCKLAFNFDPACLGGDGTAGAKFMTAFEDATMLSAERFLCPFPILWMTKRFLGIGRERRLRESIVTVHQFAEEIIRSRLERRNEDTDQDLLSRFIGTENASTEFLRDIVISFILAGRDTTSSALTWFFWLLSANPDVELNILNELESIRLQNGKSIGEPYSYEELWDMHYMHAALSEAMRLYPPVPVDTKACRNDDVLPDGTVIRKGWFMTYHTYGMGRMESVWGKDCLEYRPERWLESSGACRTESPFKFPVFHAGPRICLGKDMAYIQMKSIAASLMERFEIEVQNKDMRREHVFSLTLRMKGGLQVKVKERTRV